jgi:hypothetical protein
MGKSIFDPIDYSHGRCYQIILIIQVLLKSAKNYQLPILSHHLGFLPYNYLN